MVRQSEPLAGRHPVAEGPANRRILVVEPSQALPLALRNLSGAMVTIVKFPTIDHALLDRVQPDVVISALISAQFDILDLAAHLKALGYAGALRAITPPVPNARLIRTEVAHLWPELDFGLIELPLAD